MLAAARLIAEQPALALLLVLWRGVSPVVQALDDLPPKRLLILAIVGVFLLILIYEWTRDPRKRR